MKPPLTAVTELVCCGIELIKKLTYQLRLKQTWLNMKSYSASPKDVLNLLPGKILHSKPRNLRLIDRKIGSDKVEFYHNLMAQSVSNYTAGCRKACFELVSRFLKVKSEEAAELDRSLQFVRLYHARKIFVAYD